MKNYISISDIALVQTCGACPEQYDAYYNGKKVGYLRLRHGYFTVQHPDSCGDVIYKAQSRGDGVFEPDERDCYLDAAKQAIISKILYPIDDNFVI